MIFEGLHVDAFLVMKSLSTTPRPSYHWKAEDLSFFHVLLVWGVKNDQFLRELDSLNCYLGLPIARRCVIKILLAEFQLAITSWSIVWVWRAHF
jgi:hypothetical protein